MTENYVYIGIVLALGVLAWASLIFVIPWCMQGVLRHRLWRVRDAVFDDISSGLLPSKDVCVDFLRGLEGGIRHTRELSFANLWTLGFFHQLAEGVEDADFEKALKNFTPGERERFENYEAEVGSVVIRHVFLGTPSGWLASLLVPLYLLVMLVLFRQRRQDLFDDARRSAAVNLQREGRRRKWFDDPPSTDWAYAG